MAEDEGQDEILQAKEIFFLYSHHLDSVCLQESMLYSTSLNISLYLNKHTVENNIEERGLLKATASTLANH